MMTGGIVGKSFLRIRIEQHLPHTKCGACDHYLENYKLV
jgi:hypothetical protein